MSTPYSIRLPDDVRQWLRQRSVDLDQTLGRIVVDAVRERMRTEPAGPLCPVCDKARFPAHVDATFDGLAHAQCETILSDLERSGQS